MLLEIDNVSKVYPRAERYAIENLTLQLRPGVLGLLGPNGAGKSTLMRILATLDQPTSGAVRWNGVDIADNPNPLRAVLGYLPQDFGVYPHLSAVEFLQFIAAAKRLSGAAARNRIAELLELVNLTSAAHRPLGGFSGGMKQRVGIAQALLNDPQLLIVDEPTVGLDPEERVRFRHLISSLSRDRIVILSTHIVSDIAATATAVALLDSGTLVANDTPEALLRECIGTVWEALVPATELQDVMQRFLVTDTIQKADGVLARIVSRDRPTYDATPAEPRLEDAYLLMIGASTLRLS